MMKSAVRNPKEVPLMTSQKRRSNLWDAGRISRQFSIQSHLPIAAPLAILLLFVLAAVFSTTQQIFGRSKIITTISSNQDRTASFVQSEDQTSLQVASDTGDSKKRIQNTVAIKSIAKNVGRNTKSLQSKGSSCDLSKGKWVWDERAPLYTNHTCSQIQGHVDCMKNGRNDTGYLHWRWKPDGCDMPRFEATKFFNLMRGKTMAFVGDSIARNQLHSLLCLLTQVDSELKEIFHDQSYQTMSWTFPTYNFTLSAYWAPFLVKYAEGEVLQVHLDVLQTDWVRALPNLDVVVLFTGPWFFKWSTYFVKGAAVGCHGCSAAENQGMKDVGIYAPFRAVLRSAVRGVTILPGYRGLTFVQTWVNDHFDQEGKCPLARHINGNVSDVGFRAIDKRMYEIELDEMREWVRQEKKIANGSILKILDVSHAAVVRGDGHPGQYTEGMKSTDCLHWCVPGPIDAWNEILLESMVQHLQT